MTSKQYRQVIEAQDELNDRHVMLIFDNDGGYWQCVDGSLTEEQQQEVQNEMERRFGRPNGYSDLVELAQGAGIDADWC